MVTAVALLLLLNDKCKPESLQMDGTPGWRFPQTAGCKTRTCFVDNLTLYKTIWNWPQLNETVANWWTSPKCFQFMQFFSISSNFDWRFSHVPRFNWSCWTIPKSGWPVSSEISDLCEISDLLLFVSYFVLVVKE